MHIKEAEYGSILYQCSKGPDKSKKQGDVQSDKKAADLFWHGGTDRSTVIFSDEDSKTQIIGGMMRIDLESFEKWYANQVKYRKVVGEVPGKELREKSYSFKEAANILGIVK